MEPSPALAGEPYQTEIDLVTRNGELIVFEVKAAGDADDAGWFARKVELVSLQHPDHTVRGVFVSLGADESVRQRCQADGIELLA